jgi:DNA invertase Pin-like site-specific DNA recombinase
MNKKIENVLYIRSATNSKDSLDSQRLAGKSYAKENSMALNIIEDPQVSGGSPINERTGGSYLLHLVKKGYVETIIVDTLYRISRDFVELADFLSFLKEHNVKLIVLDIDKVFKGNDFNINALTYAHN